jgi:N-acetylneuraminic acid mutarotase/prenyltransferase beta subunit
LAKKRFIFLSSFLLLVLGLSLPSVALAQSTSSSVEIAISQGVSWLEGNQNPDGSWGASVPKRDTPLVIKTISKLTSTTPNLLAAQDWLVSTDSANLDYLARKIMALKDFVDTTTDTQSLISQQQADGGFGLSLAYQSDPLDTALAMEALNKLNNVDKGKLDRAANYLISTVNTDGGWPLISNSESNVLATAHSLIALVFYQESYSVQTAEVEQAITSAASWLASHQDADGSWNEAVFKTALAVRALLVSNKEAAASELGLTFLLNHQTANGSWNNNVYDTALALQALSSRRVSKAANIDSYISEVNLSNKAVNAGTPVTITALVGNSGDIAISTITVGLYLGNPDSGGAKLGEQVVNNLGVGETRQVQYTWYTSSYLGTYSLYVVSDPNRQLKESNYTNNSGFGEVEIYSAPGSPMLMIPADGKSLASSPTDFVWYDSANLGGLPLTYKLEIDKVPTFDSSSLITFANIPESLYITYFQLPIRLADGVWYWRVAANNGYGYGLYSPVSSFAINTVVSRITNVYASPNPFVPSQWAIGTTIFYTLDNSATVDIVIKDQLDGIVRHLSAAPGKKGANAISWNGFSDLLQPVVDGKYSYLITAESLSGKVSTATGEVAVDSTPPEISQLEVYPPTFSPNGDGVDDYTAVTYNLSEAAKVSARVYKGTNLVRTIENQVQESKGFHGFSWDGKDESGSYVEDGTYHIAIGATDLAGNPAVESNVSVRVDKTFGSIGSLSFSPNPALPGESVLMAVPISGAVTTATTEIDGSQVLLNDIDGDQIYTATITAPLNPGYYLAKVQAANALGQTLEATGQSLEVISDQLKVRSWTQTSLADFSTGESSKTDYRTSPGDILLAKNPWQLKTPMPSKRTNLAVVAKDGKIYAIGGTVHLPYGDPFHGEPSALLEIYDPVTDSWQRGPSMPTPRGYVNAAVGVDGKIYVLGGYRYENGNVFMDNVEAYDPSTRQWEIKKPMPFPLSCYTAQSASDGKIYIIGGHTPVPTSDQQWDPTTTVQAYDPLTDTWETKAPLSVARGWMGSVVGHDELLYVAGGSVEKLSSSLALAIVERYSPATNSWERLPNLLRPRMWPAAAKGLGGEIYVIGGFSEVYGDLWEVETFDLARGSWQEAPYLNVSRSYLGAASLPDGRIFAIGGMKHLQYAPPVYLDTVEVYDSAHIYPTSGEFISTAKNVGRQTVWGTISWTASLPASTSVELETQSSTDGINWSDWSAPYTKSGSKITSPPGKYIKYKVRLITSNQRITPKVSDVTITYNSVPSKPLPISPTGEFIASQTPTLIWKNAGDLEGDDLLYTVQLDTTPTFNSSNLKTYYGIPQFPDSSSFTLPESDRLPKNSRWYWRVSATDGHLTSSWSVAKQFTVDLLPPVVSGVLDEPDPFSPKVNGKRDTATISFNLSEEANAKVELYSSNNTLVKTINFYGDLTGIWQPQQSIPDPGIVGGEAIPLANGKVLLVGGVNINDYTPANLLLYDSKTDSWEVKSSLPIKRLSPAVALGPNGQIYVMGGRFDSSGIPYPSNTVQIYDPLTETWTMGPPLPTPIYGGKAELFDGKIYVFGDLNTAGGWRILEIYDPQTQNWQTFPTPVNQTDFDTVVFKNKIYLFGGEIWSKGLSSAVFAYDPQTNTWENKAPMPVARERASAVVGSDGLIYLIGGRGTAYSSSYSSRVDVYDPISDRWIIRGTLPEDRIYSAATLIGKRIFLFGGQGSSPTSGSEVLSYLIETTATGRKKKLIWDGRNSKGNLVADGVYTYKITAVDAAGNLSVTKSGTITVDNTPPLIEDIKADSLLQDANQPLIVKATVTGEPYLVKATIDSTTTKISQTSGDVFTGSWSNLTAGSHHLALVAEDIAGNQSTIEETLTASGNLATPFWQQTSKADFEAGTISDLDSLSQPGYLSLVFPAWQTLPGIHLTQLYPKATADDSGKIHIIGGMDAYYHVLSTHQIYDPVTGTLQEASPLPNPRFGFGTAAGSNGKIYAFGGRLPRAYDPTWLSQVYDPTTGNWHTITHMPVATGGNQAVQLGGKIYVVGYRSSQQTAVIQSYDPSTNSWEYLGYSKIPQQNYAVAASEGKIYLIGGRTYNYRLTGLTQAFDVQTRTWQSVASMPTAREYIAAATGPNGRIWVVGGAAGRDYIDKVEVYDPIANSWSSSVNMPVGRKYPAAAFVDNTLYVLGGYAPYPASYGREIYSFKTLPSGELTSQVFDASTAVNWQTISWTALLPEETNLEVATRSSTDGVSWSDWSSWSSVSGAQILSPPGRYLQYRVKFSSSNTWSSPLLADIAVSYRLAKLEPPVLQGPANGAELNLLQPTFWWSNPGGSSSNSYTYRLQIDRLPTFNSAELRQYDSIAASYLLTGFTIPVSQSLTDGRWYWRMAAVQDSKQSNWTDPWSFTINTKPDLAISSTDITITPKLPSELEEATITATVHNRGANAGSFVVEFYDGDPNSGGQLIKAQTVDFLAANSATTVKAPYQTFGKAGEHTIYLVVDANNHIAESSETNNVASSSLTIAPHGIQLQMSIDKTSLSANQTITVDLLAGNNGITAASGALKVFVVDQQGVLVSQVSSETLTNFSPGQQLIRRVSWNSGSTYAGSYQIKAELTLKDHLVAAANSSFTIEPDLSMDLEATANKLDYSANEDVRLTTRLISKSSNYIFRNLQLNLAIKDANGIQISSQETTISQLLPDEFRQLANDWNSGLSPPGVYQVQAELRDSQNKALAEAETFFTILPTSETGAGLSGKFLSSTATVTRWTGTDFGILLVNKGNSRLDTTTKVQIVDPQAGELLKEFSQPLSLAIGETTQTTFNYPFVDLPEGKTYLVILKAQLPTKELTLDQATLTVTKPLNAEIGFGKLKARVLVWAETPAQAEIAKTALNQAGAFYRIIKGWHEEELNDKKDEDSDTHSLDNSKKAERKDDEGGYSQFAQALRSGIFNHYWILGSPHPLEDKLGRELIEKVNAGATLLIAGEETAQRLGAELSPGAESLLGLEAEGSLKKSNYTANVLASSISNTSTISFKSKLVKLKLTTSKAISTVELAKEGKEAQEKQHQQNKDKNKDEKENQDEKEDKEKLTYPVLVVNHYGRGQAITFAFDLATATNASQPVVSTILQKVAKQATPTEEELLPYGLVPLQVSLRSLASPVKLRLRLLLPTSLENLYATGADTITTDGEFQFNLQPDETRTLEFALRLPKEMEPSTITVSSSYYSETEKLFKAYQDFYLPLAIEKSLSDLTTETLDLLDSLSVSQKDKEKLKKIKELVSKAISLTDAHNSKSQPSHHQKDSRDKEAQEQAIKLMLKAISSLNKIEAPTNEVRLYLDKLLFILEAEQIAKLNGGFLP